jgi:hypothetical protein
MPSTRSRAKSKKDSVVPPPAVETPKKVEEGGDESPRPAKRARVEQPDPSGADVKLDAVANGDSVQEGIQVAKEEVEEEEEEDQVAEETKDPSRAADLYLDTVRHTAIMGIYETYRCTGEPSSFGL